MTFPPSESSPARSCPGSSGGSPRPGRRSVPLEGGKDILSFFAAELSGRGHGVARPAGRHGPHGLRRHGHGPGSVDVPGGEAIETVAARTVVWAAGVKGSSLGAALAMAAGAELDPPGRVKVLADFSLPGHPDVFVIGDLARTR